MPDEFYKGTDWEGTSGPFINRNVQGDDLWPQGAPKDVLADGLHPVLAIGGTGPRPRNVCGVMVTYNSTLDRAVMNIAPGFVCKQYVANVTGYTGGGGAPNAWVATIAIGDLLYVDDSATLAAGCTLSRSAVNIAGAGNPIAARAWYSQTEDEDVGIGGHNVDAWPKSFEDGTSTHYLTIDVLLWPDAY